MLPLQPVAQLKPLSRGRRKRASGSMTGEPGDMTYIPHTMLGSGAEGRGVEGREGSKASRLFCPAHPVRVQLLTER